MFHPILFIFKFDESPFTLGDTAGQRLPYINTLGQRKKNPKLVQPTKCPHFLPEGGVVWNVPYYNM